MKKVKNIQFRMTLKGNGIVNFDSAEQKFMMNRIKGHAYNRGDNVSYGKKKFFKDEDGNLDYSLSISSGCMTHATFVKEAPYQSNNIINSKHLLVSYLATPSSVLRGYLLNTRMNGTLKRKSAITLVDAIQTNNSLSHTDTCGKSGKKNTDPNDTDNTFFKKESVGEVTYKTHGVIDLMQLQFMSCDDIYDRPGFSSDMFDIYKKLLKSKMPTFNSELGYYIIKTSSILIPEYGFVFSNDDILSLVKLFFMNTLELNIRRKNAHAEVDKLEYKLIYDAIDESSPEEGWVELKNSSDVNSINFVAEEFYQKENTAEAEELKKAIQEDVEAKRLEKKAKKVSEDKAKKKTAKKA